jgi:ACS family hexuronate transporter-like MFS transporter
MGSERQSANFRGTSGDSKAQLTSTHASARAETMTSATSSRTGSHLPSGLKIRHLRWVICTLLFFACTLNYLDRQTVSVLKSQLQAELHWTESDYGWIVFSFQVAYSIMLTVSGRIIDQLGTRLGYALTVTWWSIVAVAHTFARGAFSFAVARFFLGASEAGNTPAAIKAVAEWFPARERALAAGIFNAGASVGAMVAPPLVAWLTLRWSWQEAFIVTGAIGFLWLMAWLVVYYPPAEHPNLTEEEHCEIQSDAEPAAPGTAAKISWTELFHSRPTLAFAVAKFLTDPVFLFYIFWLPSYFQEKRGFSLAMIGYFAWIPFLAADIGSVAGGWLSGFWIKSGWPLSTARKGAMAVCAFCMPAAIVAAFASRAWVAVALISLATSAHQGWSSNLFAMVSDIFPKQDVASVIGLGGTGGAVGGMIFALATGYVLQKFHTYVPLFIIAGCMHLLALALVHKLIPKI